MGPCAIMLLFHALMSTNYFLSLLDHNTRPSTNRSIRYVAIFSMAYYVFDTIVDYFYLSKQNTKRFESTLFTRLRCLLIYRWVILLNLFISYYRSHYVNMVVVLIGLMECSTLILCVGHILTTHLQNTYYLRKACGISFITSIICKIALPTLLIAYCAHHQLNDWDNEFKRKQKMYIKRTHRLRAEYYAQLLDNAMVFIHLVSFIGILMANIWWTIHLWEKSKNIAITFSECDANKKAK
eukprot:1103901_1